LLQIAARPIHHNAVMLVVFGHNFPCELNIVVSSCDDVSVFSPQETRAHAIPFTDVLGFKIAGAIFVSALVFIYFAWLYASG
jgi:hypothetical protein